MPGYQDALIPVLIALAVAALAPLAEWLHLRRCRSVALLAFGPEAEPRRWVRWTPLARVLCLSGLTWGLLTLLLLPAQPLGGKTGDGSLPDDAWNRIVLVLDVSPSMDIEDAGPEQNQTRAARLREVMEGMYPRIALGQTKFSLVAFFTEARPVVIDTTDLGLIRNILSDLPMIYSFPPGKTRLLEGVRKAGELAERWPKRSTTIILCTDGDTIDFNEIPELPESVRRFMIVAVGDPSAGTFIDGHASRQEVAVLRRLAAHMGGLYLDVNTRQIPSFALQDLAEDALKAARKRRGLREWALLVTLVSASVFAFLPVALAWFGSRWMPPGQEAPWQRWASRKEVAA